MPPTIRPTQHPHRVLLHNEIHARPPEAMSSPLAIAHVVMLADAAEREASRAHVASIIPTVEAAMEQAGIGVSDLKAIAVTRGPGLIGPLLVGLNTASGLGLAWDVPVIGVNHLRGHLRSADLVERRVTYPALVLLVSGGHTQLMAVEGVGRYALLGETVDDEGSSRAV